jgi:ketosteroid isomerase-like protein
MSDPTIEALCARLERLEAERAIVDTMYAYGSALDYGDRERFLQCFTPDAEYVVDMRIDGSGGFTFRGHGELAQYFADHTHAPAAWHKHVTTNPSVALDGDSARATSYFLRVDAGAESGPAVVLASGRYVDELVREPDGSWRIRARRCEVQNL